MGYLATARKVLVCLRGSKEPPDHPPYEKTKETNLIPSGECLAPDWPTLAAQRWGPAVGDPTPGLVVDQPDPIRRRAALESLGSGPGDAFEGPLPETGVNAPDPAGFRSETVTTVAEPMPGHDADLLASIRVAGFIEVDPIRGPAWLDDLGLTVSMKDVRASLDPTG
jgi:hypothetical protein